MSSKATELLLLLMLWSPKMGVRLISKECLIYMSKGAGEETLKVSIPHPSLISDNPRARTKPPINKLEIIMKVFEVVGGGSCSLSLALYNDVTNSKELLNSIYAIWNFRTRSSARFSMHNLSRNPSEDVASLKTLTYVLVALFGASPDEMKAAEKLIDGKEIELEELEAGANHALIQKHYKISSLELGISSLADAITCRIALHNILLFLACSLVYTFHPKTF